MVRLQLSVYAQNARAVAFYEKNGFVPQAERVEESTGEREPCDGLASALTPRFLRLFSRSALPCPGPGTLKKL